VALTPSTSDLRAARCVHNICYVLVFRIRVASSMEKSKNTAPALKIVLIGDSKVGKTCLLERYVDVLYDS
jgi:GTPase SAR1 family protein